MTAIATLPVLLGVGVHGSRPAASAVGSGGLYSCTTHNLVYQTDGASWTTWATLGAATTVATDPIWDAKGDLAGGTGADTAARLAVGSNDTILMADSGQTTGLKWVASQTPSTQAFGDAAAQGTADTYARGDHKHGMPALTQTNVKLTAGDVTLSQNSYTDILTLTLGAGTWLVLAQTNITCSGSQDSTCRISDGTNHFSQSSQSHAAGFDQNHFLHALIVLGGSTSVKLQGTHNAGGTVTANRNIPTNDSGNITAQMTAILFT